MEETLRQKIIDRYTSAELIELMDIPIEDLLERLWDDIVDPSYIHIILEDLGENID
jgi:hypothetical protein